MKKIFLPLPLLSLLFAGCAFDSAVKSAAEKNVDINAFGLYTKAQTADETNATPTGKIIVGRLSYKSRKVAIPSDQKVPLTGSYRRSTSSTILGTSEETVDFDFTAPDSASADLILSAIRTTAEKSAEKPAAEK